MAAQPTDAASILRATQAPLKSRYRSDPSTALVTLSSTGTLDASSITCKLSTGRAVADAKQKVAGLHPLAGGPEPEISGELCSGDMLLEALVACAGVTMKAVATALGIPIKEGTVRAEGDLDFRGTMGVDKAAPVGFIGIRLGFEIVLDEEDERSKGIGEEELKRLGTLTERYCVVLQTITKKPEVGVSLVGKRGDEEVKWGQTI